MAVYEKQPESLRIYFPDLLGQIDLEREDRRLQKVEFAQEAHGARSQGRSASARARIERIREESGGGRRSVRQPESGREPGRATEKVLQQPAENPVHARAYYGLARIAALDHDPELAEKLFQKTLEMSPDDDTKSWAYLYLGRLSDAAGEREQAEKHYRAALAVRGAPEQVKIAAQKGLAQPFQR